MFLLENCTVPVQNFLKFTLDPKPFDYQFLATLDERGQVIPTMGIKERGENGLSM